MGGIIASDAEDPVNGKAFVRTEDRGRAGQLERRTTGGMRTRHTLFYWGTGTAADNDNVIDGPSIASLPCRCTIHDGMM